MNTFRLFFRSLVKNKVFSFITIGSFAVSISIILLLTSFLISEFGYNKHIENVNRIFRIKTSENSSLIPEKARQLISDQIPEVEAITHYLVQSEPVVYEENNYNVRVINTDEEIFTIFSVKFIAGNPEGIFENKNNAVISESLSERIFGDENPIGKVINISHRENVVIAGVAKDFPEKSSLQGDLFCSTELKLRFSRSCYNNNCTDFYSTLVMFKPGFSLEALNSKISDVIPRTREKDETEYSLISYKDVYFNTSLGHDGLLHANKKLISLLFWLTLILLILSVFNYVNLSLAQNTSRLKEFGIKQTLGISWFKIYLQFFTEAFLTVAIAALTALFLAFLIHPLFTGLLGKSFSIYSIFQSPLFPSGTLFLLALIASLSAFYPAKMATKTNARELLMKNRLTGSDGFTIRKLLNIMQFTATIAMIIALIIITRQIKFAKNVDFGFKTEQLVRIPIHWKAKNKIGIVKDELSSIPGVVSVCHSHGTPGNMRNYSNGEFGKVSNITSDHSFVETFGFSVVEGRNFFKDEKNNVCLINETAMQQAGWDSFEGKKMYGSEVVGIIEDFHYENLYNEIGALMITNGNNVSHLSVRIIPQNMTQTLSEIEKRYKNVLSGYVFSFQFYDDYLDSMYQQEEKRADAVRIIAIIAILISCFGLIGLVEFSIKKRTKEIGIRKVNGAKVSEILAMLNKDFVKWVVIAFVIATPIAYYAMNKWLENFAYKTNLSWWIFALAGLLALGIALLTVSWQSWRAATRNPVEALRYE